MSDPSILPGSELPPESGGAPFPDFDDEGGDDRRRLYLIGGGVAVVLVLIVGFLLLHGGGSSSNDLGAVPQGTPNASLVSPSPNSSTGAGGSGKNAAGTKLPKKTHVLLARDPFKPLFVVPTAPAGGSGSATVGTANVGPGSGSFTFPSGGASGGGAPTQVPASYGPPIWIELIHAGSKDAVFDVGYAHGKKFRFDVTAPAPSAVQGTVFDEEFALLGIQDGSVTVQVGDATPFDLRPGVSHPV
ncbi:MAG TPA: hypothetical protein VHB69_01875 [Mycobacteriales bacterium]|nr:hypothetical protein [Mycobacteriales bacterium]